MRKTCAVFIFLISVILNSIAQPNGGFESWTPEFSYENPDGWETTNFLSLTNPPNPVSAFKVTGIDRHSGNYALKLKTVFVNTNPNPSLIDDSAGIAFTGKINFSPFSYKNGFPFVGRPAKLEFWAKYFPVGNDSASIGIILQKWNGSGLDTIATGGVKLSTTTTYTLFQVSLTYFSTALPDSATVAILSSKDTVTSRVGSTIFIDDVIFTGWVGMDENNYYSKKVKVFPNPVNDDLTIAIEDDEAENIRIIDVSGKLIHVCKIQQFQTRITTSLFAQGIYFYEICNKNDKILTKDKFTVSR
jgi:hypothetical protein